MKSTQQIYNEADLERYIEYVKSDKAELQIIDEQIEHINSQLLSREIRMMRRNLVAEITFFSDAIRRKKLWL